MLPHQLINNEAAKFSLSSVYRCSLTKPAELCQKEVLKRHLVPLKVRLPEFIQGQHMQCCALCMNQVCRIFADLVELPICECCVSVQMEKPSRAGPGALKPLKVIDFGASHPLVDGQHEMVPRQGCRR